MASAGFDRNKTLDEAQRLAQQGKVEAAIAAYRDLVENDPQDWNSANILGDLLLKAGHADQAVAEYTRVAEHFAEKGFTARASAMYKKVLRVRPDDAAAVERAAHLADLRTQKSDCISLLKRVLESAQPDSTLAAEASARLAQAAPTVPVDTRD